MYDPVPRRCRALTLAVLFLLSISCAAGDRAGESGSWDDERRSIDIRMIGLLEEGSFGRAAALADSFERVRGPDPRLEGQKAMALGKIGRTGEAIELFEKSLLADYAVCETHLNFAVLLLETGRSGRALTELREAGRFCGPSRTPLIKRNEAVARLQRGEEELALDAVEEGLATSPEDPYLLGMKGMLIAGEEPGRAEELFSAAAGAGELDPEFLYQLGLLMLRTSRPGRALRPLEKAVEDDPGSREKRFNYAEALARSGRTGEAIGILRSLLEEDGGAGVAGRLGRLLFSEGRFDEALEIFRALPPEPENLDRVAMSLHRLGRTEEAVPIQREAVSKRPDWPTGLINLAVMLASRGELDEAEDLLVRALELDPGNATAAVNLENLRRARGEGRKR